MTTATKSATDQARTFAEQATEQTDALRNQSLTFGKKFAELSFDVQHKAVRQGAEVYIKAAEQLAVEGAKELAKLQADFAIKLTDLFVQQSREIWSKA